MLFRIVSLTAILLLFSALSLSLAAGRDDVFVGYREKSCTDELPPEICQSYSASGMCRTGVASVNLITAHIAG